MKNKGTKWDSCGTPEALEKIEDLILFKATNWDSYRNAEMHYIHNEWETDIQQPNLLEIFNRSFSQREVSIKKFHNHIFISEKSSTKLIKLF